VATLAAAAALPAIMALRALILGALVCLGRRFCCKPPLARSEDIRKLYDKLIARNIVCGIKGGEKGFFRGRKKEGLKR